MKIILNGVEKPLKAQTPITALLESEGFADKLVAVAVNGAFVPKSQHASALLKDGDQIEIVAPMQEGKHHMAHPLNIGETILQSRLFLGTAGYPSPEILRQAIEASKPGLITVSLRRESAAGKGQKFWDIIKGLGVPALPNTAGCHGVQEAITTAEMAREIFETNWIKLEVIGDDYTLQPDPYGLIEAAEQLIAKGFKVFPYMTEDLILAQRLAAMGCDILMPWAPPIGSGRGLNNPYELKLLRDRFSDKTLVIDAGIGAPSHAAQAMEMGYDAVLLNTAVAKAGDPVKMAQAFAKAIDAGRTAYLSGVIKPQEHATPSTPLIDRPFWHQNKDADKA